MNPKADLEPRLALRTVLADWRAVRTAIQLMFCNSTLYIPRGPNQNAPLPPNFNKPAVVNGVTFPALFPNFDCFARCGRSLPDSVGQGRFRTTARLCVQRQQKTVIRGFFGIFYGGEENQGGNPNRGESAPFNQSPQLNRPTGVDDSSPIRSLPMAQPPAGYRHGLSR